MYEKKERGEPKPWTSDPILRDWFFCNVFRQDDKTSVWIKKYVIDAYENDPDNWKRIIVARFFSRLDSLEDIRKIEGLNTIEDIRRGIIRRVITERPVHTQGFLVGPGSNAQRIHKWDQPFLLCRDLEQDSELVDAFASKSLKNTWTALYGRYGVGSFLAYQYVCDFAYSAQYLLNANDHDTWTAPGPGSRRGMNRVLTGTASKSIDKSEWLESAIRILAYWKARAPSAPAFAHLKLCNVQHWLCEFDKYERGGSAKRRYNGV